MTEKANLFTFTHVLMRFVPNLSSGEFVNIGVVVGSDAKNEWGYRLGSFTRMEELARVYSVSTNLVRILSIPTFLRLIDDHKAGKSRELTEAWFRQRVVRYCHMLQFSEPGVMLAKNAEAALDFVFETRFPPGSGVYNEHDQRSVG